MILINCNANVDSILKSLKKRLQQELIFTKLRQKRHYESPAQKRKRKLDETIKRKIKFRMHRS